MFSKHIGLALVLPFLCSNGLNAQTTESQVREAIWRAVAEESTSAKYSLAVDGFSEIFDGQTGKVGKRRRCSVILQNAGENSRVDATLAEFLDRETREVTSSNWNAVLKTENSVSVEHAANAQTELKDEWIRVNWNEQQEQIMDKAKAVK